MRKLFVLFCLMTSAVLLVSQEGPFYQAIVRKSNGQINSNAEVFLQFSILEGNVSGAVLYSERQVLTSDTYGWISAVIGQGSVITCCYAQINWTNGSKYLKVECGTEKNGPYNLLGVSLINSNINRGPKGEQGIQGPQGIPGAQGDPGAAGIQGPTGLPGLQGMKGDTGSAGPAGSQGIPGVKGDQGIPGIQGSAGLPGLQGMKGETGATGPAGPQGITGVKGDQGIPGIQGPAGPPGLQGMKGDTGSTGPQGIQGVKGDQGIPGIQGPPGAQGLQGIKGDTGLKGDQGIQGHQGIQGIQGSTGSIGLQGLKGDKGDKGDPGQMGPVGATGPAGSYIAGAGISISGGVIQNTGDLNPLDDLTGSSVAGGDLSGTFSNLQIKSGAVGSDEIANASIIGEHINQLGAAAGQVLKWDGSKWVPGTVNGSGLSLPYSQTYSGATNPAFKIEVQNNNTGIEVNNTALAGNNRPTIKASSTGTNTLEVEGSNTSSQATVARFHNDNQNNTGITVSVENAGKGVGISVSAAKGQAIAVNSSSNGDTSAVKIFSLGNASALEISQSNPNLQNPSLKLTSNTQGSAALIEITNGQNPPATALELKNGFIKVNQSVPTKTAYVHTTTVDNTTANVTRLSYPGMSTTDMIIVTHVWKGNYIPSPIGVYLNGSTWSIYTENISNMPLNENFNVLIIKQ